MNERTVTTYTKPIQTIYWILQRKVLLAFFPLFPSLRPFMLDELVGFFFVDFIEYCKIVSVIEVKLRVYKRWLYVINFF